jgi:RHS repeat-associated protein
MLIDAGSELMTELVPTSDSVRRRLPRWDPRLWNGHELLRVAKTRSGAELRRLGLTWGRVRAQKASSSRPSADPVRHDATPPCRAQQALAVDHRQSPALASTALGGVGGPQAAASPVTAATPRSDAAEDRRRWASPGYLSANGMRLGRLHYEPAGKGEPQLVTPDANHSSNLHIFLDLPDHLGSSSLIIDHATSELVEARTYQPYGATESDYRPERWKGFREDYGFTGKEEDVELGLIYFGKRFLNPFLGRWMSADPLTVHSPGSADLNLYAYVSGAVLKAVDPIGLADDLNPGAEGAGSGPPAPQMPETSAGAEPAPAPSLPGATLLHPEGGPVDTPLGCFVSYGAAIKAHKQAEKVAVAAKDAPPMRDHGEYRPVGRPPLDYAGGVSTTILAPLNVTMFAINGDVEKFLQAQQIGGLATAFALTLTAPKVQLEFTKGVVESYAPRQETVTARPSFYMPRDEAGRGVPLAQQKLKNGTDMPLPLPEAGGRPHTVLGTKTGSDGAECRQSATFPAGTWPKANGQDVPWGRVDWSTHGRGDHAFPHLHPFVFNPTLGWVEGPRMDKF